MFSLDLMHAISMSIGFLILFGFVLSFSFGWPLFVYEICRHHFGFRYYAAGALALLSLLLSLMLLFTINFTLLRYDVDRWPSLVIWGTWVFGPLVLLLVFRLRRRRPAPYDHKKV